MIDINKINNQLCEITGIPNAISVERTSPQFNLPLYLTKLYQLRIASVLGEKVLVAGLSIQDTPNVTEITKHDDVLKAKSKLNTVFIFDKLDPRTRQSLYRRRIAFIEIGKNTFLPFFLLKAEVSTVPVSKKFVTRATTLDKWSQIILINQLCRQNIEGKTGSELTENLGIPRMTVSRALNSLSEQKLCKLKKKEKNKFVHFEEITELWHDAKSFLSSSIKMIIYAIKIPKDVKGIISGISALSEQTMLADDNVKTIAISMKQLKLFECADFLATHPDEASYKVEVWDRDPKYTSRDGMVDPVSLYLNFKIDPDDRVQIALKEMLKKHNLEFIFEENAL